MWSVKALLPRPLLLAHVPSPLSLCLCLCLSLCLHTHQNMNEVFGRCSSETQCDEGFYYLGTFDDEAGCRAAVNSSSSPGYPFATWTYHTPQFVGECRLWCVCTCRVVLLFAHLCVCVCVCACACLCLCLCLRLCVCVCLCVLWLCV
jgi:hypothetical protein